MNPTRAYDDHVATAETMEMRKAELEKKRANMEKAAIASATAMTVQEVLEQALENQDRLLTLLRQLYDRLIPVMGTTDLPMQETMPAMKGCSMLVNVSRQVVDNTSFHQQMVNAMLNSLEV